MMPDGNGAHQGMTLWWCHDGVCVAVMEELARVLHGSGFPHAASLVGK
jgi:hypothetical protein